MSAFDQVDEFKIALRMKNWTPEEWAGIRENYAEYRAAMGTEANKSLNQFAYGVAAMNELYAALQEAK